MADEHVGDPFDYIRGKIREDLNDLADAIAGGSCASFDDYKHSVGMVEGLARAERHLLDTVEMLERQD